MASSYLGVEPLLALPVAKPRKMLADQGFDGDDVRFSLLTQAIPPVCPPRANRVDPPSCDFKAYRNRNRIKRMFNRAKQTERRDADKQAGTGFNATANQPA